jgi:hypothetical protein
MARRLRYNRALGAIAEGTEVVGVVRVCRRCAERYIEVSGTDIAGYCSTDCAGTGARERRRRANDERFGAAASMRADGSTYKEIGAALGVTAETARHYVHRAKARASAALRRKMETPAALE